MYKYDKEELKKELTLEQVYDLLTELGAEPILKDNCIICKTICHNSDLTNASHKLYYYSNTHLFHCYTECGSMDIFSFIQHVFKTRGEECSFYNAISYIVNFFSLEFEENFSQKHTELQDWGLLSKYEANHNEINNKKEATHLKIYDGTFLKNMPRPHIIPWEKEGIDYEITIQRGICYDPVNDGIIIPHYDINNQLVGIRERTLIKEQELYGKYRPAVINGKMYNHPLGYNLYNLNNSKTQIAAVHKAIIYEGEKSCIKYASLFGPENDISVAVCGSNLINYQFNLLYNLGVNEIIIAFDRQYKELKDKEWGAWTKKLYQIHDRYGKYVQISYLFDTQHLLDYKDSPIDKGKDIFLELFNNRIQI